jgi:hypothetical protein
MNKKKLIESIQAAMKELPKAIPVIFQRGHLPIGSDPDQHAEASMTETQRAELREREAKARRQAKPGKQPKNEPQVQPEAKQEASEPEWWYEHASEYDQNGCRMSETSNDVYQQMRDRLAQDFSRHMRNQQRPY